MTDQTIQALLVGGAVILGVLALAFLVETLREARRGSDFRRQLKDLVEKPVGEGPKSSILVQDAVEIAWLQPIFNKIPSTVDLQVLIHQAGSPWSVSTFLMLSAGLALGIGLTLMLMRFHIIFVVLGALVAMMIPLIRLRRQRTRRFRDFEEQFPEAIDLLGRSIRAGHAFATGLQVVAEESPDPIGAEFRQIFDEQKFGLPLEDSLLSLTDRIDMVDTRIFVTAVLIQREVGGNLAEILDKIAYTIRERFMILRQLRVYTAQGRMTGYLLSGLPIAVGFVIFLLNPEYMAVLFEDSVGRVMLVAAGVMQLVGALIIRRIIDIEI
ncbi:MAG: type II secretion system F family protein [Gemmatimonadota bacterium]